MSVGGRKAEFAGADLLGVGVRGDGILPATVTHSRGDPRKPSSRGVRQEHGPRCGNTGTWSPWNGLVPGRPGASACQNVLCPDPVATVGRWLQSGDI